MSKENKEKSQKEAVVGFGVIVREFKKDKLAMAALGIFVVLIASVFIASLFLNTEQVMKVVVTRRYTPPFTKGYILGADEAGREILWQLIIGARNSVTIGFAVSVITSLFGLLVGTIAGYYGGVIDSIIMRITDFVSILPSLMIIIAFIQLVPRYDMITFVGILSLFYWVYYARLFRGKALSESSLEYIKAAKTLGASDARIMFKELLPNMTSLIIVNGILSFSGNIGIETGLSYLGFGLPASTPSLGTLIGYASNSDVIQNKLWVWLPAALLILVLMLCINYIGQALQRSADAKQRLG